MALNLMTSPPVNIDISAQNSSSILIQTSQSPSININTKNSENTSEIHTHSGGTNNYNGLKNKPSINGVVLEGNKTSEELHLTSDKNFLFVQDEASAEWVILHNLNKYPSVTVIDSAGNEVFGEIYYNNINLVTIRFQGSFKGTATLN